MKPRWEIALYVINLFIRHCEPRPIDPTIIDIIAIVPRKIGIIIRLNKGKITYKNIKIPIFGIIARYIVIGVGRAS